MSKRIFLATSFSTKVSDDGKVLPEFREHLEGIINTLKDAGFEVFCAAQKEGWNISQQPPEVGLEEDISEIDKSDILLALLQEDVSAGVQFEIGYCVGTGKQVIIATKKGADLKYFNQGIVNLGLVKHTAYADAEELAGKVADIVG